MAKKPNPQQEAQTAENKENTSPASATGGLRSKLRVVLLVAVVLLLEGGTIAVTILLSRSPQSAAAKGLEADLLTEQNRLVEVLVVRDNFVNQRQGHTFLYDTEIFITVRKKDSEQTRARLDAMQAQLTTEIGTVFRRAEPAVLQEFELATLTRQIKAVLDDRMGMDAEGKPLVQDVFIRKCIGIRADL